MFDVLSDSLESLRSLVTTFDPAAFDGAQAMQLVEEFSELERLAAAGRTLAAGRVARDRRVDRRRRVPRRRQLDGLGHRDDGRSRQVDPRDGRAARSTCRTTAAALRSGALSDVQVDAVAKAAAADPQCGTCAAGGGRDRRRQGAQGSLCPGRGRGVNRSGRALRVRSRASIPAPPGLVRRRRVCSSSEDHSSSLPA